MNQNYISKASVQSWKLKLIEMEIFFYWYKLNFYKKKTYLMMETTIELLNLLNRPEAFLIEKTVNFLF